MTKTSENTFTGTYKDTGDDVFNPAILNGSGTQTRSLSSFIARELESFEGKKIKLTIKIEVEEV